MGSKRWERWSQFGLQGGYLAGVPVVDEERNGCAQVGEEEVQRELVVPTQPARQRAQVEDEEAQSDYDALPHLGTGGSCVHISREKRNSVATSVSDPDPDCIRTQSGQWIRIRIQKRKNDPQKSEKKEKSCFEVLASEGKL